jgi:hypothetical protein
MPSTVNGTLRKQRRRTEKPGGLHTERIPITPDEVRTLAARLYTQAGIASALGVSLDTIRRRLTEPEFSDAFDRGREAGCNELRDLQLEQARAGNTALLIHLGKHYLGQRDTVETQITAADGGPLELRVIYRQPPSTSVEVQPEPRQISPPNGHSN